MVPLSDALRSKPSRGGRTILLALLAMAVTWVPSTGQQLPDRLTVEGAIRIAMTGNAGYLQTANDVEAQSAQIRSAWGALLPRVNLSAGFSSTYRETTTGIDEFGQPLSQPKAVITKTSSSSQGISLSGITLFDGGRQFRNIDIARLNTELARTRVTGQENTLRATITRAYFQVVTAQDRIDLERQLLQFARERYDLIEQRFRIAAAQQTDLLGAELEVLQAEQSLAAARADVRRLRLSLLRALGVSGEPDIELASALPPVFDPTTLDAEALVERALSTHPTMLQGMTGMDVAEKQFANARAQRLPTLSLGLPSYTFGETERGLFDAWGSFGAPNNTFSFSLSASYPLFNGFQTSAAIASSRAAAQDARYQLRDARLQVEADARSAIIDLELRYNELLLAEQRAENAQLRLELAQEQYRLGALDFTALQQIIQQNDQAQRSVLDAQFAFLNARVTLEERIGGPLDPGQ